MFRRHGIEVIASGLSLHDQDSFYVIRAYPSVEARQRALDALFGSAEWLMQQEDEVLGMIESYNTCVIDADEPLIEAIMAGLVRMPEPDVTPPAIR
jgi:hypothetical protein